jgi:hypothetical protein
MKRRARRVTIGAAGLGAVVLGVLAVVHWQGIRDHVEAWRYFLTTETRTILVRKLKSEPLVIPAEILSALEE